jgi:hypothetical protein
LGELRPRTLDGLLLSSFLAHRPRLGLVQAAGAVLGASGPLPRLLEVPCPDGPVRETIALERAHLAGSLLLVLPLVLGSLACPD